MALLIKYWFIGIYGHRLCNLLKWTLLNIVTLFIKYIKDTYSILLDVSINGLHYVLCSRCPNVNTTQHSRSPNNETSLFKIYVLGICDVQVYANNENVTRRVLSYRPVPTYNKGIKCKRFVSHMCE